MLKKIKNYIRFKKMMTIEVLETLCTICKYLERDARMSRQNDLSPIFNSHFNNIKRYSTSLREEVYEDDMKGIKLRYEQNR